MTAVLLSAALAVLLWPDRRAARWRRAALLGAPVTPGVVHAVPLAELPVGLLVIPGAVGAGAVLSTPLVAVLAGLLALVGIRSWTAGRRDRAQESRLAGLGEALGALTAELRSGRPLAAAISSAVAACGSEETGRALARAVRAPGPPARSGPGSRDDPVASALDRLSAAVLLSTRTGCSLADVVAAVDEDLRARRGHRRELRSATAAPRASAMLLAGLPALGLAMGSGIGADPWRVLTGTGTGQVLLVVGVALEIIGLAWSRRLVERVLR